jgi:ComF family protein
MAKIIIYPLIKELKILKDLVSVIFPETCVCCNNTLFRHEIEICNYCLHQLPRSDSFNNEENRVKRLFEGRVKVQYAAALYHFHAKGRVQKIIHALKYKERKGVAVIVGRCMVEKMKENSHWNGFDLIVPVPLHRVKFKKRGFNQSELIAQTVSEQSQIPMRNDVLLRKYDTESQTRKSRWERWKNMEDKFACGDFSVEGLHILLIDDVITTGATAEACIQTLLDNKAKSVSVICIAVADKTRNW